MKGGILKRVVFFALIIVIMLSAIGTWRVITMDVSNDDGKSNNVFPETSKGSGYVSIDINQGEENNG